MDRRVDTTGGARTITVEAWANDVDWNHLAWQIDRWNITDALITAPS